jgi:SAM-dependent methyltransferase
MFTKSQRLYDAIYSFKDYKAEAGRLHDLIQAEVPGARTLLDVGCGTGMHLAQLSKYYEVEGLDLDEDMLAIARQRLPQIPLHHADMTDFELDKTFDVVVSLFSSIGYVRSLDNLRRCAGALARHVRPGGLAVVEPWFTPEEWEPGHSALTVVDEEDLKLARMNVAGQSDRDSIIHFHYLVTEADAEVTHFTEEHILGLFTTDEYLDAMRRAGFQVTHDPEGLMGRGLYVAVKP